MVLWSGKLTLEALCALHVTALVDGLTSDDKLLSLGNVACRTEQSDSVWDTEQKAVDGLTSDDKLLSLWNVACRTEKSDSVWLAEILPGILNKKQMVLWSGKLTPEALCALHVTALVDGLTSYDKLLSLWNVACRTEKSDSVSLAEILARILNRKPHILIPLAIALNDDTPSVINDPLNIQELNRGLTSMRSTATGHDDIHNEHLKHMPDNYKTWLLQLYNKSLQSGMLPTIWQPAIIIPLPKPNKPLTSVDSYRPIFLLSCVQKLMERRIVSRLIFFLEQKGVFRKTQGGYRRRLSAIHQVTKLEAAIRSTLVNKSIMVCLFVDFSSAFDTVWPMGVLYKLSRCGVRGTMLRWLQAYLKDRPFKVFMEGTYSSERIAKSGVPQGAVLSPLLFIIMIRQWRKESAPVSMLMILLSIPNTLIFALQQIPYRSSSLHFITGQNNGV
ncbi:Reverse transcriptase domain [Trinorchestia longiramus]|nr:Reverse transcriptase domain [Trinorchestia longiramus]